MELQLELKKMEIEQRRMEIQAEAGNRALEIQNEREKREHELRMAEAGRPAEEDERGGYDDQNVDKDGDERGRPRVETRRPRVETLADRVKRYGSALKQVVSPMPSDATEIPQFFESLEAMFRPFEIPADLRAKILLPFLSLKAKSLIFRLNAEELEDYEGVRDFLLSEFKLTPREYKARFDNAIKRIDETFIYFAARLRNNLRYYVRSRECLDDLERVCFLLISDKVKSCLPDGALNYALSLEENDWFDPRRIGELAETYVNHTSNEKPKHVSSAYVANNVSESPKMNAKNGGRIGQAVRAAKSQDSSKEVLCYNCQNGGI